MTPLLVRGYRPLFIGERLSISRVMIRMVAGSKTKPYGVGEIRSSHQLCPPS